MKASFLNEFRILTQVNHKNLCQLLSVYETDNSTYVILELYPLSLYGYIQKCGFPALEQAKIIMINLLEGIANLHEKGIMHRDLKLENIMVKK
jgi:serine/threonine protein kinase